MTGVQTCALPIYLASIYINKEIAGISFTDVSTGEFFCYQIPVNDIQNQLGLITPSEILIPKNQKHSLEPIIGKFSSAIRITKIDEWVFNQEYASDLLLTHFNTKTLKGFGIENLEQGIIAAGAILNYLKDTQKANLSHIIKLSKYNPSDFMLLDPATKRNLEITFTIQEGTREGTLISILDKTNTPMGSRLLKRWVSAPLIKLEPILQRQQGVEELYKNKVVRNNLQNELKEIGDLERIISKVCTGRANPRELNYLKSSLKKIPLLKQLLDQLSSDIINKINNRLGDLDEIVELIEIAITDDPPLSLNDGGVIRSGFSDELDEIRDLSKNAKNWIADLQRTERERSNIPSLKVSYNKVFGYYIEISNAHKNKIPENYIRKQTLVNSERFITPELKEYEDKILNAEEKIYDLEYQLFNEIRKKVAGKAEIIQENAKLIAMLDCYNSFAECAEQYNYAKPVVDNSNKIYITEGRHPVVERILNPGEKFTPNNCALDKDETQIVILTGPNMAGKSVYLRQIGLIVLLAQIGSFVPAKEAQKIGRAHV